jgi:histidyl-tRNA synthetase
MKTIADVYRAHGAVAIETPVLERLEILLNQYGDGGKLIYRLRKEAANKEQLALRYDLTVPMARYMISNGLKFLKRYQIADVFRRDKPSAGRYRQFSQCDFDIVGNHSNPRLCDAECLQMIREILKRLDIGQFTVKVNHRKILNGIMAIVGVRKEDFRKTCSIIDELDKISWTDAVVKLQTIGHPNNLINCLGAYVNIRGQPAEVVKQLEQDAKFMADPEAKVGIAELKQVFEYATIMNAIDSVSFDLSLARGLDYYTGIVIEAFLKPSSVGDLKSVAVIESACAATSSSTLAASSGDLSSSTTSVAISASLVALSSVVKSASDVKSAGSGAICGGGRYDDLIATIKHRFSKSGDDGAVAGVNTADRISAVGFSIGIERVFSILEEKAKLCQNRSNDTMVYVASAQFKIETDAIRERLSIISELWAAGIAAEMPYETNPKPRAQAQEAANANIPFIIWTGPKEKQDGFVKLKNMQLKQEIQIQRPQLVPTLLKILSSSL